MRYFPARILTPNSPRSAQNRMSVDLMPPPVIEKHRRDAGLTADGPPPLSAAWSGPAAHYWRVWGAIVFVAVLSFAVDVPLSRAMVQGHAFGKIHDFLESIEPFGQPPVAIAVCLGIWLCGAERRGAAFRIGALLGLSSIAINLLKLVVGRCRPWGFDFQGTVFDTFRGVFPGLKAGSVLQSCPSGHTGMAVALCLGLSTLYPQGRWLFRILAGLVIMHRLDVGAHYLSDTLFAWSVTYAVACVVFRPNLWGAGFDRLEARCAAGAVDGSAE
jgi:membrane-associated phospholipid phosphatase